MEQETIRATCKIPVKAVWEGGHCQTVFPEGSALHSIAVNPVTLTIDVEYSCPADQEVSHELG